MNRPKLPYQPLKSGLIICFILVLLFIPLDIIPPKVDSYTHIFGIVLLSSVNFWCTLYSHIPWITGLIWFIKFCKCHSKSWWFQSTYVLWCNKGIWYIIVFQCYMQSLCNTPHYNTDLDIALSSCGTQFLPLLFLQRYYSNAQLHVLRLLG